MKSAKTATGCLLISFCTNFLVRTEQSSINGSVEEFSLKNAALHSTAGNVAEMKFLVKHEYISSQEDGHRHNMTIAREYFQELNQLRAPGVLEFELSTLNSMKTPRSGLTGVANSQGYMSRKMARNAVKGKAALCNYKFDAVANIRGEVYFFKNNFFWRIASNGKIFNQIKMRKFWNDFPNKNVDAVYSRGAKIIIFSGNEYWLYTNRDLGINSSAISDFGLPMEGGIDAAVPARVKDKTYFYQGSKFWKYDEKRKKVEVGYPKNVAQYGIPENMDGALLDPVNKETYFLKGKRFWRLNVDQNRVTDPAEYIGNKWFYCNLSHYQKVSTKDEDNTSSTESSTTTVEINHTADGGKGSANNSKPRFGVLTVFSFLVTTYVLPEMLFK
ncbi:unnamed protein product [Clavelina lepadiformis]|uniref:Matrix metalloproteinase n=1 Tax=Clavelina lepadiformis TaxID=159417 RepID=A0ABP0FFE9_CLALP